MKKTLIYFVLAFAAGAALSMVVRAAWFTPEPSAASDMVLPVGEPMVDLSAVHPQAHGEAAEPVPPAADTGGNAGDSGKPVNKTCPICGMDVDPSLPTATYQGKTVGFGCAACPPRFEREPDKYGPAALGGHSGH